MENGEKMGKLHIIFLLKTPYYHLFIWDYYKIINAERLSTGQRSCKTVVILGYAALKLHFINAWRTLQLGNFSRRTEQSLSLKEADCLILRGSIILQWVKNRYRVLEFLIKSVLAVWMSAGRRVDGAREPPNHQWY